MQLILKAVALGLGLSPVALACGGCTGTGDIEMVRRVRLLQPRLEPELHPRMQPDAIPAVNGPKGPLPWGQLTFAHTSDTHGWLMGHVKEANYGADWGDYISFIRHMRYKARKLGVDFLVLDAGDLHDGSGLSDATAKLPGGVNGEVTLPIYRNMDYDLLTIGNHELYVAEVAYDTFKNFASFYRSRYLTSNVQILDPKDGKYKYVGRTHKYFTTHFGVRIMSFGVLTDFSGKASNVKLFKAKEMVQQQWFLDAINTPEPIDLFLVLGHASIRDPDTFPVVLEAIRKARPGTPVQFFGGHSHTRNFKVYDNSSTALEPGRYCETLGWFAMSGIQAGSANHKPKGVPNPSRPAINGTTSDLVYARRYLDWNRLTFEHHSDNVKTFDTPRGESVTNEVYSERQRLNLTTVYGCAPQTYCRSCVPQDDPASIYPLIQKALSAVVVNEERKSTPRMIFVNTGGIRFDLFKGPFSYDDSFIVAPFTNQFQYIPDVPYALAEKLLDLLNAGAPQKRDMDREHRSFLPRSVDACPLDGAQFTANIVKRQTIVRRQEIVTSGYVTTDDFGSDGDDTPHSPIPFFRTTNDVMAKGGFPEDGSNPETVDVVFYDFIQSFVLVAMDKMGAKYTTADVKGYLPKSFTSNDVLPEYARRFWSKDC
ncbi:hypothetical protein DRE_02969 [Drechslerella stenobrocha 248]|uniref:Uncharacterized protein n=1 Tax=Drechslerella stenobrocha 248 TaxID=1043628 RepID=W7HW63_9PEZI|nr:hypothetical protein DRE_02969 [Drechslerella stenobrocha 248]